MPLVTSMFARRFRARKWFRGNEKPEAELFASRLRLDGIRIDAGFQLALPFSLPAKSTTRVARRFDAPESPDCPDCT